MLLLLRVGLIKGPFSGKLGLNYQVSFSWIFGAFILAFITLLWIILLVKILQANGFKRQIVLKGYNMKQHFFFLPLPTLHPLTLPEAATFQVFYVFLLIFTTRVGNEF